MEIHSASQETQGVKQMETSKVFLNEIRNADQFLSYMSQSVSIWPQKNLPRHHMEQPEIREFDGWVEDFLVGGNEIVAATRRDQEASQKFNDLFEVMKSKHYRFFGCVQKRKLAELDWPTFILLLVTSNYPGIITSQERGSQVVVKVPKQTQIDCNFDFQWHGATGV